MCTCHLVSASPSFSLALCLVFFRLHFYIFLSCQTFHFLLVPLPLSLTKSSEFLITFPFSDLELQFYRLWSVKFDILCTTRLIYVCCNIFHRTLTAQPHAVLVSYSERVFCFFAQYLLCSSWWIIPNVLSTHMSVLDKHPHTFSLSPLSRHSPSLSLYLPLSLFFSLSLSSSLSLSLSPSSLTLPIIKQVCIVSSFCRSTCTSFNYLSASHSLLLLAPNCLFSLLLVVRWGNECTICCCIHVYSNSCLLSMSWRSFCDCCSCSSEVQFPFL